MQCITPEDDGMLLRHTPHLEVFRLPYPLIEKNIPQRGIHPNLKFR